MPVTADRLELPLCPPSQNLQQLARFLGVSPDYITWLASPSGKLRSRIRKRQPGGWFIVTFRACELEDDANE